MNIIFFTQDDPFYTKIFFDEFFQKTKALHEIKAIVISRAMGKTDVKKLARQMYDFYGLIDFIRMGTKYAFMKAMSRKKVRATRDAVIPRTYSLKQLAGLYGIDVIERSDLNSESCRDMLKQLNPDLFISIAAPIIFKKELIDLPKFDCINIHNGPLPRYKGMLPNFWQLYHGEETVGITVHIIDLGIDSGDIIMQRFMPIGKDTTLHELIVKTKKYDAQMILDVIEDYRKGSVEYNKMEGEKSYFTFPSAKDVKEFKRRGKKLL